jgi:putative phosphoesterase
MIGIISDSHDNLVNVREAVRIFRDSGCTLVLHAGDFVAPFAAREMAGLGCPVKAVFGNCDGEREGLAAALQPFGEIRPEPFLFRAEGLNILLTHRDHLIRQYLRTHDLDLLVYGHTHKPDNRRSGTALILNPGEAGGWVSQRSTAALLDPQTLRAEIVPL